MRKTRSKVDQQMHFLIQDTERERKRAAITDPLFLFSVVAGGIKALNCKSGFPKELFVIFLARVALVGYRESKGGIFHQKITATRHSALFQNEHPVTQNNHVLVFLKDMKIEKIYRKENYCLFSKVTILHNTTILYT